MKILVVEDNRNVRRRIVELVHSAFESAKVIEAPDASTALLLCRESPPDLLLMDVGLPDGNGITLTALITSLLPGVKVVMISEHKGRVAEEAARAAGAVAYLVKEDVEARLLPLLTKLTTPAAGQQ